MVPATQETINIDSLHFLLPSRLIYVLLHFASFQLRLWLTKFFPIIFMNFQLLTKYTAEWLEWIGVVKSPIFIKIATIFLQNSLSPAKL